jgi:hypothetical protein
MLIALIFFIVLSLVLGYIIWNLLTKVEKYEGDIVLKDEFIEKFKKTVEDAHKRIETLDIRGAFESDDEVGFFFKDLKNISLTLNAYFQNYLDQEDSKKEK